MARAFVTAFAAICSAIVTVVLVEFLDQLPDSDVTTSSEAPTPHNTLQIVQPLAATATVALFAAVALLFRHLQHAAAAGNQRLSDLVTVMFCASAGILQYVFFVQPTGVVINVVGAQVRALGLASATVAFFLGMALVLVHVRTGGGSGGGAVAGDGTVVRILSKMALGAAAALVAVVGVMDLALYTK